MRVSSLATAAWMLLVMATVVSVVTADDEEEEEIDNDLTGLPIDFETPFPTFEETFVPTEEYEIYHFDCFNCIENGYHFCPLDAQCWPNATSPFELQQLLVLPYSCQSPDDLLADDPSLCSPPQNFFSDPLYSTNEWVFDMINVRPVWEKGYFGASVR
jgi:hypothetical protein